MNESRHTSERLRKRVFSELVEHVPAVFYDVPISSENDDDENAGGYVSPQAHDILGFKPEKPSLFLHKLLELMPDENKEQLKNIWNICREKCHDFSYETIITDKRTLERYILIKGTYVRFGEDGKLRQTGMIIDISGRKRIENTLRAREERYRKITETMTDYVFTIIVENGRISETIHGGACQPITGYSPEEFTANPNLWLEMVHQKDRDLVLRRAEKMINNEDVEQLSHRIIHKNGHVKWVHSTIVTHRDKDGNILFFDGLIRDITTEKRLEEMNKQRLYMNEVIIEAVPFAAVLLNEDGEVIAVNNAAQTMGFNQGDSWNAAWDEINSAYECTRLLSKAMDESAITTEEITHKDKVYEVTLVPREPDLCLVTFYDITKRKEYEEALKADKLIIKSMMANPLTAFVLVDKNGKFEAVNNTAAQLMDVSPGEASGLSLHEIFPYKVANLRLEMIKKVYDSKTPTRVTEHINGKDLDTMLIPILDEYRQPIKVALFSRDLTDEKRSSEQLLETYQTLINIVEYSPNAIISLDLEGKVKLWNPAAERMFGWKSAEIYSRELPIFGNPVPIGIKKIRDKIYEGNPVERMAFNVRTKDGEEINVNISAAPLLNALGMVNGIINIIEKR